jgi:hypothetical protein
MEAGMGDVRADITLKNAADMMKVRDGFIRETEPAGYGAGAGR